MQTTYQTDRLLIRALALTDAAFLQRLVNTPGWLQFIGDRNVRTVADAEAYVERLLTSNSVSYRVVTLRATGLAVGVVTLIQKDYLDHPDLGFAFLPEFAGQGYAHEAAATVLNDLLTNSSYPCILAVVALTNVRSVRLLTKLGFRFAKEIKPNGEPLSLYALSAKS